MFNVRCFVILSYFLVVEDNDLSQRTSRLLSMLLTLEYVTFLSWPISFFSTSVVSQMMFSVRLLRCSLKGFLCSALKRRLNLSLTRINYDIDPPIIKL